MTLSLDPDTVWIELLRTVLARGDSAGPRSMGTTEVLGSQSIWSMDDPVVKVDRRKLGYRYMAAEAAWILSGDNRVETIGEFSKLVGEFSDDGVRFFGAYGPKVVDQLSYVVATLREDPQSRRAVMNLWREQPSSRSKDVPCTLSLQFVVRGGALHCLSTMRSNDLWLGTPYDVFTFSQVAAGVLVELRRAMGSVPLDSVIMPGLLIHTVGSLHLYDRNRVDAAAIVQDYDRRTRVMTRVDRRIPSMRMLRPLFGSASELAAHLWRVARFDGDASYSSELKPVELYARELALAPSPGSSSTRS